MTERPILVLDSGIGGLPYVSAARLFLPRQRYVYIADHARFPYGEKSPDELRELLLDLVGRSIEREHPVAVLVACNTATVVALNVLRSTYATPFVGVVPAVKPAAASSRTRRIGVLATTRTVEEQYLHELVGRFARDVVVTTVAAGEIVRLVEESCGRPPAARVADVVGPAVERLREARVDIVVLGCTHFIFLLQQLRELFGHGVTVIDSREGVARQLQRVVDPAATTAGSGSASDARDRRNDRFYTTGSPSPRVAALGRRFGFREVQQL